SSKPSSRCQRMRHRARVNTPTRLGACLSGCWWNWSWCGRSRPRRRASSRRWCRCRGCARRWRSRLDRSAQSPKRFLAVKQLDVLGLSGGEAAHGPGEMHEMRLARGHQRVHAALLGQVVALPRIARAARGHHVGPVVVTPAGERNQMIAGQAFAVAQVSLAAMAVLAAVAVAGKEECVGDLATEAAGDVY